MAKRKPQDKHGYMRAGDLMEQLANDPEYQARLIVNQRKREAIQKERTKAEKPVLLDLAKHGLKVDSLWDLADNSDLPPHIVPILLHHLKSQPSEFVKEDIARSLGVPSAQAYWSELKSLFMSGQMDPEGKSDWKFALAHALAKLGAKERLHELIELVQNPQLGPVRVGFLPTLAQSSNADAQTVLRQAAKDPALKKEAQALLKGGSRHRRYRRRC